MRVQDLSGAGLDFWVAKALGHSPRFLDFASGMSVVMVNAKAFSPTRVWSDGGPLLEREIKSMHCDGGKMMAVAHDGTPGWGRTYLEASGRAIVSSKYGQAVPEVTF
jgi:hypothetical protein